MIATRHILRVLLMVLAASCAPPGFCQEKVAGNAASQVHQAHEKLLVSLVHERKESSLEAVSRKSAT
ncbi:MAG: hypothetical protein KJZ70_18060, partial [Bryobacterales bacterium]|nr:hypothetical protein [Bryobacterales bacterium]